LPAAATTDDRGANLPTRRVFFALWPDETQRAALSSATREAVQASGGRAVEARNLHVTLLFLGSVVESRIHELRSLACRVAAARRDGCAALVFDRIDYWKKPQVLVLTTGSEADRHYRPLEELAETLRRETVAAGFAPDLKPFRSHITLARKVPSGRHARRLPPISWRATAFALVESRTQPQGADYHVLESFPVSD
jgi:2'-5' RNA ligase